jgi:hypothetical protein
MHVPAELSNIAGRADLNSGGFSAAAHAKIRNGSAV